MSMYRKLLSFSLLTISTAFANNPNANLGPLMADAATDQMIKMFPLFMLALGIAVFFSLVQKKSKKSGYRLRRVLCNSLCIGVYYLDL